MKISNEVAIFIYFHWNEFLGGNCIFAETEGLSGIKLASVIFFIVLDIQMDPEFRQNTGLRHSDTKDTRSNECSCFDI